MSYKIYQQMDVLYHTRPSVDGLMPETIMLLSPICCFDFLMESLPSNFCDQNTVDNYYDWDLREEQNWNIKETNKEPTFLVDQNSSSVRTLLSTNCLCNFCNSLHYHNIRNFYPKRKQLL